ncbi:4'-phosphopantetheinyl transferase family protein [Streptomyces sp. URMC 123]|uniref:4'-phosphopantetheinyl transferase family protein n=1 Tax=Streptomyces sp. URMC 123 TaxID=3423403 RepID=UPI003F1B7376
MTPLPCLRLDPDRPLHLGHGPGRLTVAVVSIAWLRRRTAGQLAALEARHLAPEEAAHAATLTFRKRRYEWLAGRLALKHGVCAHHQRHLGPAPPTRAVRIGAVATGLRAGKPVVDLPVEIGLSHSVDFAVAACGPRPIGVDLERCRRMAPPFVELLADGADLAMPLPLRWACKEAVLKHFGFGLRVDSREVRLTGWGADGRFSWRGGPELCRHAPTAADGRRFATWAREIDGYALAMVWK